MKKKSETSRQRSANFSRKETLTLVDFCFNHRDDINQKRNDFKTIAKKNKAWSEITAEFNKRMDGDRTVKAIRAKFDVVKNNVRKKLEENPRWLDLKSYEKVIRNSFLENAIPEQTTAPNYIKGI